MDADHCAILLAYCEHGTIPTNPIERETLRTKDEYLVKQGILYRVQDIGGDCILQLCVPKALQSTLIMEAHIRMGHASADSMHKTLRQRYYFPMLYRDCTLVANACMVCQQWKAPKPSIGKVGHTQLVEDAHTPGTVVLMDAVGPYGNHKHATKAGNRMALVLMDEMSRFIQVFPTPSVTEEFVAQCVTRWSDIFGTPQIIKSDRASNLISAALKRMYDDIGALKTESAGLRPESHGKIEICNQWLHAYLRTKLKGQGDWDLHAGAAAKCWNSTYKIGLGAAPFTLMFGRQCYHNWEWWVPRQDMMNRKEWEAANQKATTGAMGPV